MYLENRKYIPRTTIDDIKRDENKIKNFIIQKEAANGRKKV